MIFRPRHLKDLQSYKAGKSTESVIRERGLSKVVKLASNENPLGLSSKAIEAIKSSASKSNRYPDPSGRQLTSKLAVQLGITPEQIILGAGVDSLLGVIISAFSKPNDELLTSEGTFTGIYVHTNKLGRKLVQVPHDNYCYNLDLILEAITPRTRIIYLANPNNPTGTIIARDDLGTFLDKVPQDILVILDEAYFSYANQFEQYSNGLEYNHSNLIVTRTFSKDYGLAGLRIGYALAAPDLISDLARIRLPFEPSLTAQQAAIASLDDHEFLVRTLEQNHRSLDKIKNTANQLGLNYQPTYTNFLMFTFDSTEIAVQFTEECLNRGLILRHVESFGVGNGVRINSGTDEETDFAVNVIAEVSALLDQQLSAPALGR